MKMRAVERAMLAAAVGVSLACSASAEDVELSFVVTGVLQGSSGADSLSSEGDVADASTSIDGYPVSGKIQHSNVPRRKIGLPFIVNCVPLAPNVRMPNVTAFLSRTMLSPAVALRQTVR